VKAALAGLLALVLLTGCLRFGYDAPRKDDVPDASHRDAGVIRDAEVLDATPAQDAAVGGGGGSTTYAAAGTGGMAGAGTGGSAAGSSSGGGGSGGSGGSPEPQDAGVEPDAAADSGTDIELGDTGLSLSDVLGYYNASLLSGGDWGAMILRQYGSEVVGVYQYNEGTVVGEITSEGVFVGWWSQLPSRDGFDAGEVEFRWSSSRSGIEFDGRWRWGTSGSWYENWDASLVTDRAPPPELIAAFDDVANFKRHP
jgi:hypothetical protein